MKENKNICLLTDCLESITGGAERKIFELAQQLGKMHYKVFVASLDCEGQAIFSEIKSTGCRLIIFPVKRIYDISGLIQGIRFYGFLKKEKIDILQTYHFSSDIWGTFWAHWAGVKCIISNRRDMGFWRGPRHVQMYRLLNGWVSKIVVVSEAVKNVVMKEEGVPADKIEVIYNGVELSSLPDSQSLAVGLKRELGIKDNEFVLMHLANFKPVKGHMYLLQAVADVVKEFTNIKLVLVGEDELNGALQRQAQELEISDRILFLGKRSDARRLLACADICMLPSLSEGMSNAILEYMDAGKPVVATRVGGNPETVADGVSGILVEPKDAKGLAEALKRLLKDANLRLNMGAAGRKRAEETFDIRKMYEKYEQLFADIMTTIKG